MSCSLGICPQLLITLATVIRRLCTWNTKTHPSLRGRTPPLHCWVHSWREKSMIKSMWVKSLRTENMHIDHDQNQAETTEIVKHRKTDLNFEALYMASYWSPIGLRLQITLRNLASHPFNIYPSGLTKIYPLRRSTNGEVKHGHKTTDKTNFCLILIFPPGFECL